MAVKVTSDLELPASKNWNDWLPNPCPNISGLDLWKSFNPGWLKDVTHFPVDQQRTFLMTGWDDVIRTDTTKGTRNGVHGGAPFQRLDQIPVRSTKVYVAKQNPSLFNLFPSINVPLPDYVPGDRNTVLRRFGDPTVAGSDAQSFLILPLTDSSGFYYELSAFGPSIFPYPFRADRVEVWDLAKDWRTQARGITGAKVPFLPMLPTFEEYETSINHALHFVAAGYAPELTGIARSTDGTIVGHPLRAGERLRLKQSSADRLLGSSTITKHDRTLVQALLTYGMILTDKTGLDVPHNLRQPMDPRVEVKLPIRLVDFEVVYDPYITTKVV